MSYNMTFEEFRVMMKNYEKAFLASINDLHDRINKLERKIERLEKNVNKK